MVRAHAVAVRVGVAEDAGQQHLVRARRDAGYEVRRREGGLLDLREVVLRVAVEGHLAHMDERVVAVRPHLGEVERVEAVVGGLGVGHHLHRQRPGREVAAGDRLRQVADVEVRVFTRDLVGVLLGEDLVALVRS